MDAVSRFRYKQQQQQQLTNTFRRSILKHSQISLLIWNYLDNVFQSQLVRLNSTLEDALQQQESVFQVLGPEPSVDKEQVFEQSLRVWREGTTQMARTARANNIKYYHVLQPNQYLPDSKELSETEKKSAYVPTMRDDSLFLHVYKYQEGVEELYPQMREIGQELEQKSELRFIDATQIFKNTRDTIYVDPCCHYNERGSHMLIDAVADKIQSDYERNDIR